MAVAHAGVDCSFEEADYYTLRDRLREMAQVEGRTVAVGLKPMPGHDHRVRNVDGVYNDVAGKSDKPNTTTGCARRAAPWAQTAEPIRREC